MIRRHFVLYGRVQGVGLRYRAYHVANSLGVTGWVRNKSDGSVELVAQGDEELIDRLILSIEQGSFVLIENLSIKDIPTEKESSFEIRD